MSRERGSSTPLIVAFVAVILLLVAAVVDASAAYLARQRLDELADGAALQGADLGAQGQDVYDGGLGRGDLAISRREAERAVRAYLRASGAHRDHPGLRTSVRVDGTRIVVELTASVDLPLGLPGAPARASVRSVGSAVVDPLE
ncbi:putative Flp pilus-assembly TadE/G-like protein [Nocardioides sp. J9]|uniref:pilus assembly protein TadG-related protein n=1 Tax=unclassified Nocardioides TaxID=2615069 RepID=UPI00048BFA91|nr:MULTISPECIES: pilus assembly protein TadG-related protein [unclassified Nocardioides]TWH03160.1 putative Flp pilus-assembly TadE/G-like protein [Nocardioides sp. J9]